jgi:hypothetical protein
MDLLYNDGEEFRMHKPMTKTDVKNEIERALPAHLHGGRCASLSMAETDQVIEIVRRYIAMESRATTDRYYSSGRPEVLVAHYKQVEGSDTVLVTAEKDEHGNIYTNVIKVQAD